MPIAKAIFRTNRIEIHGDSIIHFGNTTVVERGFKNPKIYNLINKPLPHFVIEKYKGGNLTDEDLKGKPTILNLWFTSCSPCINEMADLNDIKEKYGDKFNYIGMTFDDRPAVYDLFKRRIFKFDVLINAQKYIDKLDIEGYPELILIDKNNIVRYVDFGIMQAIDDTHKQQTLEELYKIIDKLSSDF